MTDQVRSQLLGFSLALTTAIGVIAYERLVKAYSYFTVGILVSLSYIPFWLTAFFVQSQDKPDLGKHKWSVLIFILSGVTGPIWYAITRKQSVAVGAIYEVKYIVIMAIIYLMFGTQKLSVNTVIGIVLAMLSVYFISKQ